jgi:hypothetical protein
MLTAAVTLATALLALQAAPSVAGLSCVNGAHCEGQAIFVMPSSEGEICATVALDCAVSSNSMCAISNCTSKLVNFAGISRANETAIRAIYPALTIW